MRIALSIFLFTLLGDIRTYAQSEKSATATAHIGRGYELVQSDRYAEAAQEFRSALALDPVAPNARYQLAICLFALAEHNESRKEFERLDRETKDDPNVAYYLARLDLLAGDSASAVRRLAPLMPQPPFPDTAFYLGSAYLANHDLEHAIQWLLRAADSEPRDFRIHYKLARALQQAGRRQESEREYALSTTMREHYNESARQSVACVQALRTEPIAAAREICNRLFDPTDPDKLTTLGMIYGENGKYEEAVKPLNRAATLDPDSFEIYHNLGLTYFRLKRFAEARDPLEKAVSLRPDFFGSNALLGATLYALKDDRVAYNVLDFAHQLKPDDNDTTELLFRVCVILGNKTAEAADYVASLKFLGKAADLHPGNPELMRRIAEIKELSTRKR